MIKRIKAWFRPRPNGPTVADLMPLFLASRREKGLRKATLTNYGCFAERAVREFGSLPLTAFGDAEAKRVIDTHCRDEAYYYLVLIRWAIKARKIPGNHTLPVIPDAPRVDAKRPCYMPAGDVRHFLQAVLEVDAEMLPAFILGFYAGLRPMEICRIRWQEIQVADSRLNVEAMVSKIREHRLIEHAPPILWDLLSPLAKPMGRVIPEANEDLAVFRWIRVRQQAARIAGVRLGHDIVRHTFATHMVALTGELAVTAHILGHHDLRMISRHYNGVATRAEGIAYFDLDSTAAMRFTNQAKEAVYRIYGLPLLGHGLPNRLRLT